MYGSLVGEGLEDGARLFSVGSSDTEIREIPLRHKRTWFFVKLELVAPRSCEVSILGDIKNSTEHSPGQPALVDPALKRRAGLDCVQRCLPASTALSS